MINIDIRHWKKTSIRKCQATLEGMHKYNHNGYQISSDRNLIGLLAEYAFAKWAKLDRPKAIEGAYSDGGSDFTLPSGLTIDIKGSKRVEKLMLPIKKKIRADIYVLAMVDVEGKSVRLMGWATAKEMSLAKQEKSKPDAPSFWPVNYTIGADELRTMSTLRPFITRKKPVAVG